MNRQIRQEAGLTLLEILVAMSILFMAVTSGMLAFQSNQQATSRATKLTHLLTHVDPIVNSIQPELGKLSNAQGQWLGISYEWHAELIETRPARLLSATSGEGSNNSREFSLYSIHILMEYEGVNREFHIEELTWHDLN